MKKPIERNWQATVVSDPEVCPSLGSFIVGIWDNRARFLKGKVKCDNPDCDFRTYKYDWYWKYLHRDCPKCGTPDLISVSDIVMLLVIYLTFWLFAAPVSLLLATYLVLRGKKLELFKLRLESKKPGQGDDVLESEIIE